MLTYVLLALVSAVAMASSGIIARFSGLAAAELTFYRLFVGGLCLLLFVTLTGKLAALKGKPDWRMAVNGVLLAGCSGQPASTSYFPLEAGKRWVYEQVTEWENNTVEREPLVLSALGSDQIESGSAWRRRSDSGIDYWLRADDSGIYRVATKTDLQEEPEPDKAPRFVLNATARYGVPLANGGEVYAYTDWAYRSEVNFFLYESVSFRGQSLLEGGLRTGYLWDGGDKELALFGRNITDEEVVVGGIDFNNLTGFLNEPRTWGVEFTAKF